MVVMWCIAIGWVAASVLALVFNHGCARCREHEEDIARDQAAQLDAKRAEDRRWDEDFERLVTDVDLARRDFREDA